MSAHSGPSHDLGCLAARVRTVSCHCGRRAWLEESVPRHVARAELLMQISRWSAEQAKLAWSEHDREAVHRFAWEHAVRRAITLAAHDMYVQFGHTVRSYLAESNLPDPHAEFRRRWHEHWVAYRESDEQGEIDQSKTNR